MSEKLDGVRAYWNGSSLRSRRGNVYVAPEWFTSCFPSFPLDGELWLGRGKFEELVSIVRKRTPENDRWQQVKYMVFDLPKGQGSFTQRLAKLRTINLATKCRIQIIKQWRVNSTKYLDKLLNKIVKKGGEGLMLHQATATYRAGRTGDLLKMKPYLDAEAKVLGYSPGKGKYINKLGAIVVETEDGKKFKIGSGFSDADRESPPPIGQQITYKYYGKTKQGLPRFASYLRIRSNGRKVDKLAP